MAQTTRTRTRMCLLGVSLALLSILGVKFSENLNFHGVNRRFQAKRAKYWKFHVIETTASISTKFCTTIETIKLSSRVVPIRAQRIQDGGRPLLKKTVKSPYLCNRLTEFDEIWYSDACWPLTMDLPLNYQNFEKPYGGRHKNRDISAKWRKMGFSSAAIVKIFYFRNPRWRTAAILKTITSSHLCNLLTEFDKI